MKKTLKRIGIALIGLIFICAVAAAVVFVISSSLNIHQTVSSK